MKQYTNPVPQYFDNDGDILSAGSIGYYENGSTTTKKNTYNADGGVLNKNPVVLSAEGRLPQVWGDGLYTVICRKKPVSPYTDPEDGEVVWTRHGYEFATSDGQFGDWNANENYDLNDIRKYNGDYYQSEVSGNIGNVPSVSTDKWSQIAFLGYWNEDKPDGYANDAIVIKNGYLYRSLSANNTADPEVSGWENLTFNNEIIGDLEVTGTITSASQIVALKTSNQTVTSSTTLVDVSDISLALVDGVKYAIRAHIRWNAGATTGNGIKVTFTGATHSSWLWLANTNASTSNADPTANASGGTLQFTKMPNASAAADEVIIFDAVVTASASPYKMQFAQATSSVTATQVSTNTYVIATRLN
jgi:hypothetical protein